MKRSERILLGVLGAVVAVGFHVFVTEQLSARAERLRDELHRLELTRIEAETLLEEQEEWLGREAWLNARLPTFSSDEVAAQELLAAARSAEAFSLKVDAMELLEISATPPLVEAGIRIKMHGSLQNVCEWLHDVQQPDQFREIRHFALSPGTEASADSMTCELTLIRTYRLQSSGT